MSCGGCLKCYEALVLSLGWWLADSTLFSGKLRKAMKYFQSLRNCQPAKKAFLWWSVKNFHLHSSITSAVHSMLELFIMYQKTQRHAFSSFYFQLVMICGSLVACELIMLSRSNASPSCQHIIMVCGYVTTSLQLSMMFVFYHLFYMFVLLVLLFLYLVTTVHC